MREWPNFVDAGSVERLEAEPLENWLRGRTVPNMMLAMADTRGDAIAHRFLPSPEGPAIDQSYAELAARMTRYAAAFAGTGDRPVVASLLPGLPEKLPLACAAMWAGIYLPINPFLEAAAIVGMLEKTGAGLLLVEGASGVQGTAEKLDAIRAALPHVRIIICGEDTGPDRLEDWLGDKPDAAPPLPEPDDIAAYFHTGGTTGLPKIARLTHANLAFMAFLAGFGGGMRAGDVIPCGMPLFHVGGLVFGGLAPFAAGASVVQLGRGGYRDRAMTEALWTIAARESADILFAPPTIALAALERFAPPAPPTVRHWVSSAAPLPAATHRRFTETTGIDVKEAWGLTEASLVLTFTPPQGESRPGSVGLRLPYCDLAVVPLEGGEPEPGETGIVMARSPGLFAGYLGHGTDGLETVPCLGDGRWLNTGDVGWFDADGYLHLTGRAKDLILRGGHNIDPAIIEEAFGGLEEVSVAAAIGRPDRRVGELPVCYVTLKPGMGADAEALLARAAGAIDERAAHPKAVHILDAMPLTAVGKIDKVALRRDAAERAVRELYPHADIAARTDSGGRVVIALTPCPQDAREALSALGLVLSNKEGEGVHV
ncbi:AMP-binding protein [Oceaniradius stylonematis]|uniref:AMP-binding protein n=1 Tax=Oceaniradius stylonematis TaxID=2184161 RepID=UPI00273E02EE|nr:AMP-binding protein [Oceaniradius stylonematis]